MQQIRFFWKNKADFSNLLAVASASEFTDLASRTLDRSNLTAWLTTGSVDSDNTTFEVDFTDPRQIDSLFLVKHNFKSFEIEYWDGDSWVAMPDGGIDLTNCTDSTSFFEFTKTSMEKIRITIRGTQVPDEDKYLYQFIATEALGQLNGWPIIKNAKHAQALQTSTMLSGRMNINKNLGGFSCELGVSIWRDSSDLALIEALHVHPEGFLVWLCGGDEAQFSSQRKGYRKEDVFLMKCVSELTNDFYQGLYKAGLGSVKVQLVESNE